jgi:hypothetical protein
MIDISDTPSLSIFARYGDGIRAWDLEFGTGNDGKPIVQLGDGPAHTVQDLAGGYHLYELAYDPSAGTADLLVDGIEVLSGLTTTRLEDDPPTVAWGGGSSVDTGNGRYNLVAFELLGTPLGSCAPIAIANAGFEAFALEDNDCSLPVPGPYCIEAADPIPGWTLDPWFGDGGSYDPGVVQYPSGPPEGENVAFSSGGTNPTISQSLSEVLSVGATYFLLVDVGHRSDNNFPGYSVQLRAGASLLAQESSLQPGPGTFATSQIVFTASEADPIGENLMIRLDSAGSQTHFDDVRLCVASAAPSPVPVPAGGATTWIAIALLLVGFGFAGRRAGYSTAG